MQQHRKPVPDINNQLPEINRTVLDALPEMISLHDGNFNILFANKTFLRECNLKAEDLQGKKCYEVFHGTSSPPEFCPLTEAIISEAPVTREIFEPKLGKYLHVSVTPIRDEKALDAVKTLHIARDITSRKEAERALQETNQRLEELVRLKTEVLDRTNRELRAEVDKYKKTEKELQKTEQLFIEAQKIARLGNFEWDMKTNEFTGSEEAKAILGLSGATLSFVDLLSIIKPSYRESVLDAIKEAVDSSTGYGEAEFGITGQKDGEERFLQVRGKVTKDRRNQPLRMRGVVRDITARRKAQVELLASSDALIAGQAESRRLAAKLILKEQGESRRLATELKINFEQRIQAALDEVRVLKERADHSGPQRAAIDSVQKSLQRLLSKTHRILRQLYPLDLERQRGLAEALREKCDRFSRKHTLHIDFEREGDLDVPPYIAVSLYQIVEEGLANISRHSKAKNVIVSLKSNNKRLHLTIEDDGVGLMRGATEKGQRGLGLAGIEERARMMNGSMRIRPGARQGAVIEVEVPMGPDSVDITPRQVFSPQLTERQIEVVRLLAEGFLAKEIAAKLKISSKAVEFHKYRVMKLLGLRSTAELIKFAVKNTLV